MTKQIKRKLLWMTGGAVLALVAAPALAADDASAASGFGQQDIIVTATKRNESIRHVAAPISAISGEELGRMNANSLGDYITRLPGVVFNDYQPGVSEVVIRGIAATTYHEQGQTTVGYYLNEVDIVEPGFPIGIPDVDTFDLDRVEVLRGPQGTLFGSSTLGGLVNYVAKIADPTKIDAAAEGLIGSTKNAGQANYAVKAMVNVPIIADKLAVRVMALQRFDAGYLDNVGVTPVKNGSDDFRTRGLRGSIVFTPAEGTKITYLGTYQDTKLNDQTYISTFGTYERSTGRLEPQKTSFFLNSLRLDQEVGDLATLTVLGSIDHKKNYTLFTDPYGYVTGVFSGPNVAYDFTHAHADIKTIEARLASKDNDGPLRWLVGASYLRATKYSFDQLLAPGAAAFIAANPGSFTAPASVLAPNDRVYGYLSTTLNTDFGIFGEATWKPVKGLEITAGGRYYRTRAAGSVTNFAGFVSGSPVDLTGHLDQKESGFTPKATITVRPNDHLLGYFTYSRGYRVGGINPNAGLLPSIQNSYKSDTVDNYEAGVKTTLFDGRVTIDASLYDIQWHGIQARLFGPAPQFYSYVTNAGSANIVGFEFSGSVKITRRLTAGSNITIQDGKLTKFLPDTFAAGGGYVAGTTLPGSSKWSVANNISYAIDDMPLKPSIELAHRYLSKAPVAFGSITDRGGFDTFDARVAITLYDHFRLTGFIDNISNTYGILNGPFASSAFPNFSIIRPRTFGMRIDWSL